MRGGYLLLVERPGSLMLAERHDELDTAIDQASAIYSQLLDACGWIRVPDSTPQPRSFHAATQR